MNTYIALLRGINVIGKNSLPMAELVALLAELGARDIKTYIQSGNAVFRSAEEEPALLSQKIASAIKQGRGFAPVVIVLRPGELDAAIAGNPFPEAESDPATLHFGFLASTAAHPDLPGLSGLRKSSERFLLTARVFYLHAPEGVGRSKLAANAEKLLGVAMTDRNWRTVSRIQEMAREIGA